MTWIALPIVLAALVSALLIVAVGRRLQRRAARSLQPVASTDTIDRLERTSRDLAALQDDLSAGLADLREENRRRVRALEAEMRVQMRGTDRAR